MSDPQPPAPAPAGPALPTFDATPSTRDYVHVACGGTTTVGDWALEGVCHPLNDPDHKTMCAVCRRYAPIADFAWADTDERLVDYHKRLRVLLPPWAPAYSLVRWLLVAGLGVAGLEIASHLTGGRRDWTMAAGALIGATVGGLFHFVLPRLPKIDFRRYV